ncbi:MAG TPA: hypothetical protein VG297_17665 [Bryobacteraceae bacterium]|jgi:hypothetical protein|nr:hypothetical protein [Bryobacteraceae bacterium]
MLFLESRIFSGRLSPSSRHPQDFRPGDINDRREAIAKGLDYFFLSNQTETLDNLRAGYPSRSILIR